MKKSDINKKETEEIYVEVEDSEDDEKGKPSKNSDLTNIIIFLVVIAVISGAAYLAYIKLYLPMTQPQPQPGQNITDSYIYKGFEFKKIDSLWTTDVQVGNTIIQIWVHNGAREVWRLDILGYLNTSFDQGPVYITFDPRDENKEMIALAAGELSLNIVQGIDREVIGACARNETDACSDRPIVTCDSEDKSVIYLKESNTTWVQFEQNCIIVRGRGEELLKAADKLILYWYGIVPKEGKVLTEDIMESLN